MKEIKLGRNGKTTLVDDDDYEFLNKHKWHYMNSKNTGYAVRRPEVNGKKTIIYMHTLILQKTEYLVIDHVDGNGLNNCKKNLRLATLGQNRKNSFPAKNSASGYKGVSICNSGWMARIVVGGKTKYLGLFKDSKKAAIAYNVAALLYHGEFARLNDIKDIYSNDERLPNETT